MHKHTLGTNMLKRACMRAEITLGVPPMTVTMRTFHRMVFLLVIMFACTSGMANAGHSEKRKEHRSQISRRSQIPLRHEARWQEKQAKGQLPLELARLLERKGDSRKAPPGRNRGARHEPRAPHVTGPGLPGNPLDSAQDTLLVSWVKHYSSGLAPSLDAATAITYDASGNVFVAGYTTGIFSGYDFITTKYNSTGTKLWSSTYNGPANDYDAATAMVVDASGNVYVTGSSFGVDAEEDFATIKYNSSGVQQWVARYNGPANDYDAVAAIRVDPSGNVYVAGTSYGVGTDADYATVKYNSAGVQLWAARFDGGIGDFDAPAGLGIDLAGSVYVSGTSFGLDSFEDFTTVKYSFTGAQVWVTRYDGPGNDYDAVASVTTDISGNTYITGTSYNINFDADYMTVKYDTFGDSDWDSRHNSVTDDDDVPTAITIDASRNVYVTGASYTAGSMEDYVTIKYSSTGTTRWTSIYNGSGNSIDLASAIAVDGSGNVYVTGSSVGVGTYEDYATVKYNSLGAQQWAARYDGASFDYDAASTVAVDGSGNVYVAGVSYGTITDEDVVTLKYNASGAQQWEVYYNGLGNSSDDASGVALDASGNIYLTGTSYDLVSQSDYATVKYDPAGNQLWVVRYNGSGDAEDFASSIVVDASGNVYVTGTSYGFTSGYDITTVKYSSAGNQLWVARYTTSGIATDEAFAITLDGSGNVYVTGSRYSAVSQSDYVTIKYTSSGSQSWVAAYNGTGNFTDEATSVAVDASGNVYVAGGSTGITSGIDIATVKYNSSGSQQWVTRYAASGDSTDRGVRVRADGSGNVYTLGTTYSAATGNDFILLKYNSSGSQQWAHTYSGVGANNDIPTDMKIDASGNILITGGRYGTGTGYDFATLKYNGSGTQLWAVVFNSPENDDDVARALTLDAAGNIYVTGYSFNFKSSDDFYTLKYNSSGVKQWSTRLNSPANFSDEPLAVAVDATGNIYVAGFSETEDGSVYTLAKYPAPMYSPNTTSIAFSSTTVGCRGDDSLLVSNVGQVNDLVVYSATSTDQNFTVSPSTFVVPSGGSLGMRVRFAPLSSGTKSGKVLLVHSGISSPDTVNLSGTGTGSGTATLVQVTLGEKWRLFSLPVSVLCPFVVPFSYQFTGQYIRSDSLANGKGYWTKLTDPLMSFTGFSFTMDTISVNSGWNLIGSVTSAIPVSGLTSSPDSIIRTSVFGYNGAYAATDSIRAGFGYWVKVSQAGLLYLHPGSSPQNNAFSSGEFLAGLSALEIVDNKGMSQMLYFGAMDDNREMQMMFELPPPPPEGGFDVRFESDRQVELANTKGALTSSIHLRGAEFPVTVRCIRDNGSIVAHLRVGARDFPVMNSSTISIESAGDDLVLQLGAKEDIPQAFRLEQNYPNPFNPNTEIRYQVPEVSNVSLVVYDVLGRVVRQLVAELQVPGSKSVTWDGTDGSGNQVASGMYLYRLEAFGASGPASSYRETRKMLLLK